MENIFSDAILERYNHKYLYMSPKAWDEMDRKDYDFLVSIGVPLPVAINIFLTFYKTPFVSNLRKMRDRKWAYNKDSDIQEFVIISHYILFSYFSYFLEDPLNKRCQQFLKKLSETMARGSDDEVENILVSLRFSIYMGTNIIHNFDKERMLDKSSKYGSTGAYRYGNAFAIASLVLRYPDFSSELMKRIGNQFLYNMPHPARKEAFLYSGIIFNLENDPSNFNTVISIPEKFVYVGLMRALFPYDTEITKDTVNYYDALPLATYDLEDVVEDYISAIEKSGMDDLFSKKDYSENYFFNENGSIIKIFSEYYVTEESQSNFISLFESDDTAKIYDVLKSISQQRINEIKTRRDSGDEFVSIPFEFILKVLSRSPMIIRYLMKKLDDPEEVGRIAYTIATKIYTVVGMNARQNIPLQRSINSQITIVNMILDGTDIDTIKSLYGTSS